MEKREAARLLPVNDVSRWTAALRRVAEDAIYSEKLRNEINSRALPTWNQCASYILESLGQPA